MGAHRTGFLLDTPLLNVNCEVGDHHPGAMATFGKISVASSGDDLFYSDLILIWGCNPSYTQIPNVHFINEARYKGAWVVSIAPDYNASAIHTDEWIPVEVASDAAFGLALSHVIVEEELYDAEFVREQTDLPLLVRNDDHRFLRRADLAKGGEDDRFYVFDEAAGEIREVDPKTLALGDVTPALEGEFRVATREGEVGVRPVFSLLREQLRAYAPEKMQRVTGVGAKQTRALARRIARARAATMIANSNFGKFYHGLEMERVQILVLTLCGQLGKKGAGMNAFPAMTHRGHHVEHHQLRLPLPQGGLASARGEDGADLREAQARRADRRDDRLRADPGRIPQGGAPLGRALLLPARRPRRALRQLVRLRPPPETPARRLRRRGHRSGLAARPAEHTAPHLLRNGRQRPAPHPRLRPPVREPPAEARPAGHPRLAHEQHGPPQRLRLPGRGVVRKGRHHLGHAHRPLRPRHHRRRASPGGVEERLGVPLPLSQGGAEARRGAGADQPSPTARARPAGSTGSTTSSPLVGATPRKTPKGCSTRCSGSRPISEGSAGRSSRRRASRATRSWASTSSTSATPPTSPPTRRSRPAPGTPRTSSPGRRSPGECSSTSITPSTSSWAKSFRCTRSRPRSAATTRSSSRGNTPAGRSTPRGATMSTSRACSAGSRSSS